MSGGYGSSGSSRGSTPSPRSSSYIQPLSFQKEPKQSYDSRYLNPGPSSTLTSRGSSSSSKSSSTRRSTLKPLSVDYPDRRSNDRVLDKSYDSRYYPNSYQNSGKDAYQESSSRKELDTRYISGSSYR